MKTEDAKQASDTFEKKQDAVQRANEIAENKNTKVIEHKRRINKWNEFKPYRLRAYTVFVVLWQ